MGAFKYLFIGYLPYFHGGFILAGYSYPMDKSMLYVTGIVLFSWFMFWLDQKINGRIDKDD